MWYNSIMDGIQIIIYDKAGGEGKDYFSRTDTISKMEVYDRISQEYSDDRIKRIRIQYPPIKVSTLDKGEIIESIDPVIIGDSDDDSDKLSKLKEELGKHYG